MAYRNFHNFHRIIFKQLFLMLLTTGIKIDPCHYPGSKNPDQNTKLSNHSGDRAHDRDQN